MQNTRIFLHFSLIQVCASLWGCLPSPPRVLVVPARVQPQHPLLVLKWPINCWPTFHGGHAHFSLRCFDNGNYLELSSGLAEDFRSSFGSVARSFEGDWFGGRARCHNLPYQKRKFIYIVLRVGCRARVAGICPLSSLVFLCPSRSFSLPVFVSLIFWFISRFSLNDAKLPGH